MSIANKLVFPTRAQGSLDLFPPGLTYREWLVALVAAQSNGHALGAVTPDGPVEYVRTCFAITDAVIARLDAEAAERDGRCPGCSTESDGMCHECEMGKGRPVKPQRLGAEPSRTETTDPVSVSSVTSVAIRN